MRLTILLLVAVFVQVNATTFAQRVTLKETNAPLTKVFKKINQQTGYDFFVSGSILKSAKPITIDMVNAELSDVLTAVFKNQSATFTISEKTIIVAPRKEVERSVMKTADIVISGTISDENGQPLKGANIRIKNSGVVAIADEKGMYNLQFVQTGDSLVVSYIGYLTQVIPVNSRNKINVVLKSAVVVLDQVVVAVSTGYQVLSKDRVTGSFGKPDMQTFSERTGTNDVVGRLDGLVPGLTVLAGQGRVNGNRNGNGASQQQSLIRGNTTVSLAQQPIYVVNGVKVTDFSAINPNDIQDITVLKDAAALAIYGANAANGVIVLTTKSGNSGGVKISYSANFNFQGKPNFDYVYNHLLTSSQFIQAARETFDATTYPFATLSNSYIAPHETILYSQAAGSITDSQANSRLDSLANINNAGQIKDLWYRNAYTMNHTVSASGGNAMYNFYSSISYINNHNNEIGATNNAYAINLTQNIKPNKWLNITLNTSLTNTISNSARPISIGAGFLPYQLFKDANNQNILLNYAQGLSPETRADYQERSRINLDYSPLDELNSGFSKTNNLNINTSANVGIKIWKGLSFEGTYGYQKAPGTNTSYDDSALYAQRDLALGFTVAPSSTSIPVYNLPITGGRFQTGTNDQRNWTLRNQLIFNTGLVNAKDRLNVQIGQEAQEQLSTSNSATVRGYNLDLQTYTLLNYATLNQGVFGGVSTGRALFTEPPYSVFEERTRYTSYFGLLNYSYNERYDFDASIRTDHSNLFAADVSGQKKPTYSIGAKWQISKEDFMKNIKWVQGLGLRATYGITGNSPYVGAGSTVDILVVRTNSTYGNSLAISTPPNRRLSFEKTKNYNIGIDFNFFNYRLGGSIDVYKKNTTDLLGKLPVNPLNGFDFTTGNLGNLNNRGIELSLRSTNVQSKDFKWSTSFVFSYNKNKLVSYQEEDANTLTDSYRLGAAYVVGYSSSSLFAYHYAGLDKFGDPQIRLADGKVTKTPDTAKATDLVYMGSSIPKFNGGLSNNFRYKNLSLAINVVFNLGGVMRRDVNSFYTGRLTGSAGSFSAGNISAEFADRWKVAGDEERTDIPSYVASQGENFRRNTAYYTNADINVVSSSYAKVRDLTLSYDLNEKLLQKLKIQTFRVFVQTGNYMLWKANKYDIDPEYNNASIGSRGLPNYGHSYSVGINASF